MIRSCQYRSACQKLSKYTWWFESYISISVNENICLGKAIYEKIWQWTISLVRSGFWAKHFEHLRKIASILWPLEGKKIFLRFDLVTYFLIQSHPWSHFTAISYRQTVKASLRKIVATKMWPLQCKQNFIKNWPSDQVT